VAHKAPRADVSREHFITTPERFVTLSVHALCSSAQKPRQMFYLTSFSFAKIIQLWEQKKGRGIKNISAMRLRAKLELLGDKPLPMSLCQPQIPHNPVFVVEKRHWDNCLSGYVLYICHIK
jgi:hypothetical protein